MSLRFQADADFNQIIVSGLVRRFPGLDFRTATEAGLFHRVIADRHPAYAQAWHELLSGPTERLLALLEDRGERARALRQCSPFAGIVGPAHPLEDLA
jgi:hypothetical protein